MTSSNKKYPGLPQDTAQVGRALFGTGENRAIGDQLDTLLNGINFVDLGISGRKSASSLSLLALITILQYNEGLPDKQAAEAVRTRIDWKYALHLPINFPGIEPGVLCGFRSALLFSSDGQNVFQLLLNRLAEAGLLSRTSKEQVLSVEVIKTVCSLSRLEDLLDAMCCAIEALAAEQTEWLRANAPPFWFGRYSQQSISDPLPSRKDQQEALANSTGKDILRLLTAIDQASQPEIAALPEVIRLRKVWYQQYDDGGGKQNWRSSMCASCTGNF